MKISLLLSIVVLCGMAQAQAQTPAATSTNPINITPEDFKTLEDARRVAEMRGLWTTPIDWKETDASTLELVAHARKELGDKAPIIEVRSKDSNRSTFTLAKAPLGPMLWTIADLANTSVWIFPGRLVLAREGELTPAERTSIKEGLGGEWQGSLEVRGARWSPNQIVERLTLSIVGNEIKARLTAKGITPPVPQSPKPTGENRVTNVAALYSLPLSEFSPQVQDIIQKLYMLRFPSTGSVQQRPPTLPSSTIVNFDDKSVPIMTMSLENPTAEKPFLRELGNWFVIPTFKPQ